LKNLFCSFPRSAWECRLDALRRAEAGDAERPTCIPTRSVGTRNTLLHKLVANLTMIN